MIGSGSLLVVASISIERYLCYVKTDLSWLLCYGPEGFSLDSVHGLVCSLTITTDM